MPDKKPKAKKPKGHAKLSQKERFLAAAKQFEADETGETFDRTFKAIAKHKPPLPGRLPEAEVLQQVSFWFVGSKEAKTHTLRLRKLQSQGIVGLRRHRRTDGEIVDAYELTDKGLKRLPELTDPSTAERTRGNREYLRDQARKQQVP
jgi:hypothetical protein